MRKPGFTLVDLLVVIAIIGLIMGLLLPAVFAAREAARRISCANKIRQVAIAVENFHGARRRFPPGRYRVPEDVGPEGRGWSWIAQVLPFLEESFLDTRGDLNKPVGASKVLDKQIPILLCPSDGFSNQGPRTDGGHFEGIPVGQTNYKAVSGANWGADESENSDDIGTLFRNEGTNGSFDGYGYGDGIMFRHDYKWKMRASYVSDGLSKTFMIGEDLPQKNTWCSWPYQTHVYGTCAIPPNYAFDEDPNWWPNNQSFRSNHGDGLLFAYADTSVRYIGADIKLHVYRAMATRNGGESDQLGGL